MPLVSFAPVGSPGRDSDKRFTSNFEIFVLGMPWWRGGGGALGYPNGLGSRLLAKTIR